MEMKKVLDNIKAAVAAFERDAEKVIAGGHGAGTAGVRSRKVSMEIARLMKNWREESVK